MNAQRFFGQSAREALRQVRETLGTDAIVLSNRSVDGGVEIVALPAEAVGLLNRSTQTAAPAAVPAPAPAPAPMAAPAPAALARPRMAQPSPAQAAAPVVREVESEDFPVSLSARARQAATESGFQNLAMPSVQPRAVQPQPAAAPAPVRSAPSNSPNAAARAAAAPIPTPAPAPRPQPTRQIEPEYRPGAPAPTPAPAAAMPPEVMAELSSIRGMIEQQLAGFAWGEMSRNAPARTQLLGDLLSAGFSTQLAKIMVDELPGSIELANGRLTLRQIINRDLKTLGSDADIIDRGGVYALVGPTGVGKTTTTAKLAARCVVRHGADKVALLTTDGYRIGAHEQLRIYGRILGVSVHAVRDASDLRQTLHELRGKHMVLIDTAGVGQKDRMVAEQAALLMSAKVVRRLLLLNSTSRGDTLDDVVRAYNGNDLAGAIITKVDEAVSLAPVVDVLIRHKVQCYYIANGQRVPEDLHLPNRNYLLHRALKLPGEASPHAVQGVEAGLLLGARPATANAGEAGGRNV